MHKPRPADLQNSDYDVIQSFGTSLRSEQTCASCEKTKSLVVIMRIIFLLTALVGLLLLSITLNAVREGKIFRRLKKRLGGSLFSSTEKYFPGSLEHNFY